MKKTKTDDQLKSAEELDTMLKSVQKDLARLIIERNAGRLANPELVGEKRRQQARLLTFLRMKKKATA